MIDLEDRPQFPLEPPEDRLEWVAALMKAIEEIPYGEGVLRWHEGKVASMEITQKRRFTK